LSFRSKAEESASVGHPIHHNFIVIVMGGVLLIDAAG